MDNALRKCTHCALEVVNEKDLDLFEKANRSLYGRLNLCKSCRKERDAKRYIENRERINAMDKAYRHSEQGKATKQKWLDSEVGIESKKRYDTSEKGKIKTAKAIKKYRQDGNGKKVCVEATKRYNAKPENRDKLRANWAKHSPLKRAKRMQRVPNWLTEDDFWMMEQAYIHAKEQTIRHGIKFHVDHIIPLQGKLVSGLHVPSNLQVIPWYENLEKSNKLIA